MKKYKIIELKNQIGKKVEFFGRIDARREQGKINFIEVSDSSGTIQVVFSPDKKELYEKAKELGREEERRPGITSIIGIVEKRPRGMENQELKETGGIEVKATGFRVLDLEEPSPIPLYTDGYEINEEIRLKYRYLDLRRERLRNNLILRHKVIKFIRDYLSEREFIEVETPILTKSTPEGARDYVVPSRIHQGKFYALPQSPQQYKQLLMIAGLEKYFQIARCFRDEDTRGDRQPEFTQLDLEMSYISREDILSLIEDLYKTIVENKNIKLGKKIKKFPFPRLTYKEAMEKYGTDRPDLRENKDDRNELAFVFIVDFPMFEKKDDGSLGAIHHPFTLPTFDTSLDPAVLRHSTEEGKELLKRLNSEKSSLELYAYQYDLVCNGYEIGGGSIRTFDRNILKKVFQAIGHSEEDFKNKFGHLWDAFGFGVPPHGGIAMGLDRFIAILAGEPNIREVIAFPKTGDARDPMMESPSEIDEKQLKELGLEIKKKK